MRQHVAHTIDRELYRDAPISDADWEHNMRVIEGSREFGDPAIIDRISAALNIADAVVGKLVKATDEDLRLAAYIALTLSPFKARGRTGGNTDEAVGEAARGVVAELRQDGWRLMRNPPSYEGHAQTMPVPRCENCD